MDLVSMLKRLAVIAVSGARLLVPVRFDARGVAALRLIAEAVRVWRPPPLVRVFADGRVALIDARSVG